MSTAQEFQTTDGMAADDEWLLLPAGLDPATTYDVLINGDHVWSLTPAQDTRGARRVAWPKAIQRRLLGRAEIVLREHLSGTERGRTRHVFGGRDDLEVRIVDSDGHALILDKWGQLIRPLSSESGSVIDELMDHTARLLEDLQEKAGVPAFICYGTLLGAVRNGRLIGHDNDIDVAYLSEHPTPVDVVREGYRVERALREAGWLVRRGSGVRLNVRLRLSDGSSRFIDVFTAHWVESSLYIPSDTGFPMPREAIVPLGSVELMGRKLPAPADPERLLAATYGEGWLVPDPSFRYETPRGLTRRLGGWFGGLVSHRKHWDSFDSQQRHTVPKRPTPFARWVANHYPSTRPIVDVGAGTGRDAIFFASERGRRVLALDYVVSAVRSGQRIAENRSLPIRWDLVNLYDTREVMAYGARLSRLPEPADVFARFLPHNLEPHGRENLWRLASMALRRGGHLFVEFRTPEDRDRPHVYGQHPRNFLEPDDVVAEIEAAGGTVVHLVSGKPGLAKLREEDPAVCRIIARWNDVDLDATGETQDAPAPAAADQAAGAGGPAATVTP
ncbi:class I SAM-dependent methyltransferase [Nocardioides sp. dk4132]|uniref:class I SAM-dependent methyltransferase n=1 Tax=unclassified Nocardioides TaxID=2615069 RepID=UPI0012973B95|nr:MULTISPECIES: class I SAM-dependent methyltransferase [unclassified Nocardioides]MQW75696.1 class I SAM-dependent methyltransferase [Nocardioides sp. dk4132]QGA08586.1 class I SAM-dependent methyltransferase [Nocardioides sp. dk884]